MDYLAAAAALSPFAPLRQQGFRLGPAGQGLEAGEPGRCCRVVGDVEFPHSAVDDGSCRDCHSPHGSAYPSLLKSREDQVCFECHDQGDFERSHQHEPVKDGQCSTCHAVHGGDAAGMLKDETNTLCRDCHNKAHDSKEFNEKLKNDL